MSRRCGSAAARKSDARKAFFAKEAGGKFQMADPGGVWIDVTDE